MSDIISIDPVTRLEGHLSVRVTVENGHVSSAYCSGEMFRGFEILLRGRDPLDAQQITQRICGVCPVSHGLASCLAQEEAYKIGLTNSARILRNLLQAANYLQSHIIHFYQLSAIDFIDVAAVRDYRGSDPTLSAVRRWIEEQLASKTLYPAAPFLPRLEGNYATDKELNITALKHYFDALRVRQLAHQVVATFGGKAPHLTTIVPGGVTEQVTTSNISTVRSLLQEIQTFVEQSYIPDVFGVAQAFKEYFAVGRSGGDLLSYGVFPQADGNSLFPRGVLRNGKLEALDEREISEQVRYSFFSSASGLHPSRGETKPQPKGKEEAYSWLKAPRYAGSPMEVGPLARVMVAYYTHSFPALNQMVDGLAAKAGVSLDSLNSVIGRHACRAIEAKLLVDQCLQWVDELRPGETSATPFVIPASGAGAGLWEAPRGALGHWIEIKNHLISNYQCVVPSTWNCSPRDDQGKAGPVETALKGTPVADKGNPLEVARVIRSFDPCLACAVH